MIGASLYRTLYCQNDTSRLSVERAKDAYHFGEVKGLLSSQDSESPFDWLERQFRLEISETFRVGELSTSWNPLRDGQVFSTMTAMDRCAIGSAILPKVRMGGSHVCVARLTCCMRGCHECMSKPMCMLM